MTSRNNEDTDELSFEPPQAFEVSLARKIESMSNNLLTIFQKLDVDRDGYVTRSDLKIALHNMFGIDLDRSQMDGIFARFAYYEKDHRDAVVVVGKEEEEESRHSRRHGIRYTEFVEYIHETALWSNNHAVSEYGSTLQLLHNNNNYYNQKMYSITPPPNAVTSEMRHALGHLLRQKTGLDMKNTHLFMGMDTQRNARVSPDEFREWTNRLGLTLTKDQVKTLLGKHYKPYLDMSEFVALVEELKNYTSDDIIGHDPWWKNKNTEDDKTDNNRHPNQQSPLTSMSVARQSIVKSIHKCADDGKADNVIAKMVGDQLYQKKQRLFDAFRKMNSDGSGQLDLQEFQLGLKKTFGLDLSEKRAQSLLEKFDQDGDGKLDKIEFVRFIQFCGDTDETTKKQGQTCENLEVASFRRSIIRSVSGHEDELQVTQIANQLDNDDLRAIFDFRNALHSEHMLASKAFHKFDKDRSGQLDFEELKAAFTDMKIQVSDGHLQHIFKRFDSDGTGKLAYHQFLKLISSDLQV